MSVLKTSTTRAWVRVRVLDELDLVKQALLVLQQVSKLTQNLC